MDQLIEFKKYPLTSKVLDRLLQDKTTKRNIIWATDSYKDLSEKYSNRFEITRGALQGIDPVLIQPRAFKAREDQQQRTKSKAEVFTPPWIVNKMINHVDEEWFGQKNVFNQENGQTWTTTKDPVPFKKKNWKKYVTQKVLEITCGEAPFIVSRYDASSGEIIPIENRIGILDRKLRVINENTDTEVEWGKWAEKAFKSVFGYEYQGDNLLIGRCNLLSTFADYYTARWKRQADEATLIRIANIIAWNFWQMDGLTGTIPLGLPQREFIEQTLFEDPNLDNDTFTPKCRIQDWNKQNGPILFQGTDEREGGNMGRKFDVVVGNPPYQQETTDKTSNNGQKSRKNIFHLFQIEADKIANDTTALIYPAGRWIHQSGKGVASFGLAQINDPSLAKIIYYPNSKDVFGTAADLADGVSIVIKNKNKNNEGFEYEYDSPSFHKTIHQINPGEELMPLDPRNGEIIDHIDSFVRINNLKYMHSGILPRSLFGIESDYIQNHKSSTFEYIQGEEVPSGMIKAFTNDRAGKSGRAKWFVIPKKDVKKGNDSIYKWKVVVSSANAGGQKRDNQLEIIDNQSVFGRSRVALKTFNTAEEAQNFYKYMKSYVIRFAFLMTDEALTSLGKKVPDLLNYKSDNGIIDFSGDVNAQLFDLLGLSDREKDYIIKYVDGWRPAKNE